MELVAISLVAPIVLLPTTTISHTLMTEAVSTTTVLPIAAPARPMTTCVNTIARDIRRYTLYTKFVFLREPLTLDQNSKMSGS